MIIDTDLIGDLIEDAIAFFRMDDKQLWGNGYALSIYIHKYIEECYEAWRDSTYKLYKKIGFGENAKT